MMRCILYLVITILLLLLQYHHVAASVLTINYNITNTTEMSRDMQQKLALFQFKLSFSIDTSPQQCYGLSWSMDSDYCKWDGVTCNQRTGDVIGLDLSCSNLVGSINPNSTLFQLSHLQVIIFDFNYISGVIPEEIFHLPNLKELYIFLNSTNNVSISLPKLKWGSSNTLQSLQLSEINIIGGVLPDSIGYLNSLTSLSLWYCNLSAGPIPESMGNLTQLTHLDLYGNQLSGQIPDSLANLKKLVVLDLGGNNLIGEFPSCFANLTQLSALHLDDNSLTGSLPTYIPPHSLPQLFFLDLYNNSLSGTIPSWLLQLPSLTSLYIDSNKFIGQLPYQFNSSSSSSLQIFHCSNNLLNGTIPKSFYDQLVNLILINLSSNKFSGVLDLQSFSPHLRYLVLHSNMLNGLLSSSICHSTSLQFLNLSRNNFSGLHPVCPGNVNYSLSVLDMRMNNITGSLPSTLSNFRYLRTLNFNGNKLQGTVPISFSKFHFLEVLDLGGNQINDTFPLCLEALPKLQVLILKSNKFHGIINNIAKIEHPFPSLTILDLSENEFSGPLPAKYIKNFKGMMNEELQRSPLDYVGDSYYEDSISLVIKGVEMDYVKILTVFTTIDLSRNKFNGEITKYIGNLVSLRGLNLSHNNLIGSIPSSIGNLSVLESLDFSSNHLVGEIPQQLTQIDFLEKLNLSQNDLNGRIPEAPHFTTFDNNSYSGNPGLCGLPLSKKCKEDNIEPREEDDEGADYFFNDFSWEAVVIGYGCGVVVGFIGGYIMFMAGKPKWYVGSIVRELGLKVKRIEIVKR